MALDMLGSCARANSRGFYCPALRQCRPGASPVSSYFLGGRDVLCLASPILCFRHRQRRADSRQIWCASGKEDDPGKKKDFPESDQTDWRAFRAKLIASEQQSTQQEQQLNGDETSFSPKEASAPSAAALGKRWAHPILKPEPGCVLIATEKLDEVSIFERTVIILLSAGTKKGNEGPFGLILNRPLPHIIKNIRPNDAALVDAFGHSQVHFGGPLVSDLIMLLQADSTGSSGVCSNRKGYQEVVNGIYYSPADGLDEAVEMVRDKKGGRCTSEDFRFFFGYAGWASAQLEREVEDGYWYIAACSTNLFLSNSAANLWEEILRLMGGQYAELSKKPKKKLY